MKTRGSIRPRGLGRRVHLDHSLSVGSGTGSGLVGGVETVLTSRLPSACTGGRSPTSLKDPEPICPEGSRNEKTGLMGPG